MLFDFTKCLGYPNRFLWVGFLSDDRITDPENEVLIVGQDRGFTRKTKYGDYGIR